MAKYNEIPTDWEVLDCKAINGSLNGISVAAVGESNLIVKKGFDNVESIKSSNGSCEVTFK